MNVQLQFVIDLVRQNSFSWNKAGTDRLAEMVLEKMDGLFPHHRVVDQAEVGNLHILSNRREGRTIYLLGHMDTVFPPDHPFRECRVEGDELHGPGAGDMKAGVATIVFACRALGEAGLLDDIPLTVIFSGDEEVGAVTSRAVFEEEREKALACLVVEGGGLNREIVVSRNGKIGARLECVGRDDHVGTVELEKASAVLELAHKTVALEGLNGALPGVRVNVGQVEGGLGPATVPARARGLLDVRWQDQRVRDELVARLKAEVRKEDVPGCRSGLTIVNERAAWPLTPGTRKLGDLVKRVGAELGYALEGQHRLGTSDSNFFGSAGVPTVDGLGPVCKGYHTPEELVYISSIGERTGLLTAVLAALGRAVAAGEFPGGKGA